MNYRLLQLLLVFISIVLFSCSDPDSPDPGSDPGSDGSILLKNNVNEPTVLRNHISDPSIPDYIVEGMVNLRANVDVEPGTFVMFRTSAGFRIMSDVYFIAKGDSNNRITFTGEVKVPGSWRGIYFDQTKDVRNELSYCNISYGGSEVLNSLSCDAKANVGLGSYSGFTILSMENCILSHSGGYGVAAFESEFRSFKENRMVHNTKSSMLMSITDLHALDGSSEYAIGNGANEILVVDQNIDQDDEVLVPYLNDSTSYRLDGNLNFREGGLKIEAGVKMLVNPTVEWEISKESHIVAKGTAAKPIEIIGANGKGSWQGILIRSNNTINEMDYIKISGGGLSEFASIGCPGVGNIGIYAYGSTVGRLKLTNSEISDAKGCGVVVHASNGAILTESGNTFMNNDDSDICN